jgi:hypothetical protein
VAFNFLTALNPASPTFDESNQKDVRKRPSGGVQKPSKVASAACLSAVYIVEQCTSHLGLITPLRVSG